MRGGYRAKINLPQGSLALNPFQINVTLPAAVWQDFFTGGSGVLSAEQTALITLNDSAWVPPPQDEVCPQQRFHCRGELWKTSVVLPIHKDPAIVVGPFICPESQKPLNNKNLQRGRGLLWGEVAESPCQCDRSCCAGLELLPPSVRNYCVAPVLSPWKRAKDSVITL